MNRAKQKQLKGPKIRYPYDVGFEIARFAAKGIHEFKKCRRWGYPPDITEEQWEKELDEMEYCLREVADNFPHNPYNKAWDYYWLSPEILSRPEYSAYKNEIDKYNTRIDNGLHLFAKRLCSLWD